MDSDEGVLTGSGQFGPRFGKVRWSLLKLREDVKILT